MVANNTLAVCLAGVYAATYSMMYVLEQLSASSTGLRTLLCRGPCKAGHRRRQGFLHRPGTGSAPSCLSVDRWANDRATERASVRSGCHCRAQIYRLRACGLAGAHRTPNRTRPACPPPACRRRHGAVSTWRTDLFSAVCMKPR